MLILIDTDGEASNTKVFYNGEEQKLVELNITVSAGKRFKLQQAEEVGAGKKKFSTLFGDDVKKYDEFCPPKK